MPAMAKKLQRKIPVPKAASATPTVAGQGGPERRQFLRRQDFSLGFRQPRLKVTDDNLDRPFATGRRGDDHYSPPPPTMRGRPFGASPPDAFPAAPFLSIGTA